MTEESSSVNFVLNKSDRASSPNTSRRTSSTVSTRSQQRRASSLSRMSKGSDTPLTPEESPPFRLKRKRTASVIDRDKDTDTEDPTPSHTRVSSGDSAAQLCLCQPDPKIPRPRNAFILYRQHYQAGITAQHPGLSNPEISKIIGEQWRTQSAEVKNEWKVLAEEEKSRHQQQYPEYRYQPRRAGRRGSISSDTPTSAGLEKARCQKCGGRSIITPTPNTAFSGAALATSSSAPTPAHPLAHSINFPPPTPSSTTTPSTRYLPMLTNNLSLDSPYARRFGHQYMPPSGPSPRGEDRDGVGPLSPDPKRRRFNDHGPYPQPVRVFPPPRQQGGPGTPFPFAPAPGHVRRESLPKPERLLRGSITSPPGAMGPPPRPGMGYHQHRLSQGHDLSLTLPPLQTGGSSNPTPGGAGVASAGTEQARSVEAMVMSMPFIGKIKVLGRIAPPLRTPGPTSPAGSTRGAIVAIEGDDPDAVAELTAWLENFLERDGEHVVQVEDGPKVPNAEQKDVGMAEYLGLVADWHARSREMIKFITTEPASPAATTTTTTAPPTPHHEAKNQTPTPPAPEKMELDRHPHQPKRPLLLLRGYSLAASNAFACRAPIADTYSPADHWQWSATLWRGIVGPDLTVYARDVGEVAEGEKAVEVRADVGVVVVRRWVGGGSAGGGGVKGFEGSALRRLGFEVGEWVRGVAAAAAAAVEEGRGREGGGVGGA
ncbi:RuvB ATP-dependent DNA helicase pontin [Elasticomyces elasticus]|nr:RuvB ATP-dependent DNA helicase pontin [Elasticomyces elasticus]